MGKAISRLSALILFSLAAMVSSGQKAGSTNPAGKPDSAPQTLSVPADSPRWDLEAQAKATDYRGRKCLLLDGGAAVLNRLSVRALNLLE